MDTSNQKQEIKRLRSRVQWWKRKFNLREYTIRTRLPEKDEMPHAHAQVIIRGDHDKAFVTIHPFSKYADFWIIHELMHVVLHCIAVEEGKAADLLEERACNRVAKLVCTAYKFTCPPDTELA